MRKFLGVFLASGLLVSRRGDGDRTGRRCRWYYVRER